jgi:hypothetical protein
MKQAVAHDAFELLGKLDAIQKDMTALKRNGYRRREKIPLR